MSAKRQGTPNMEEDQKLLSGYKGVKSEVRLNNKGAANDFINAESGRASVNPEMIPTQTSVLIEPDNLKAAIASDAPDDKTGTLDNDIVLIKDVKDFPSIIPAPESDGENNEPEQTASDEVASTKTSITDFDNNLPNTVTLLKTPEGSKCYLIGTAHFSVESQNDVAKVIQTVQPNLVMVELCKDRIHVLQLDEKTIMEEAKKLKINKILYIIEQHGAYKGLFYILLLNLSAHLTKVLGMAPGGEFRTAFREAKKIPNCLIQMGDRPIKITFARAFNSLSWWQTIKLSYHLLKDRKPITQEDIEKFKQRDSLEQVMADLVGEYPELGEVFVNERDLFLTHSLQLACRPRIGPNGQPIPMIVVGVVGIGHTLGIIEHWGKVERSQIIPIMSIPPTSLSSKILRVTIKASFWGCLGYVGYKIGTKVFTSSVSQFIKSSVEGLVKVSASP